jgi:2-succinyl-6-hydroxy-2,4-cyclohexadiene-1-carboxylate synthase
MTPQVLALHGYTGLGTDFAPFAELCDFATWHCPDLPGHGPNPQLDCTPEATLDFIQSQSSALRSPVLHSQRRRTDQPSVLLGYSMGARAALLHAFHFPKKWDAVILISPNPGIEDDTERAKRRATDEKLARRIEGEGASSFIKFWQNTPMIRSQKNICEAWRRDMQKARGSHTTAGLAASLRQFGQGQCPDLWPELNQLTLPTLLLSGSEDQKYTRISERMSQTLPNATHQIVKKAGHMPHLEKPEICAGLITDFLEKFGLLNVR